MGSLRRRALVAPGLAVAVWISTASPAVSQQGRERSLTPQEFGITEEVTYNLKERLPGAASKLVGRKL